MLEFQVLVLLLLLVSAACNLSQSSVTDMPIPTTGLETYTNATYGYRIEYPEALLLEADPDKRTLWIDKQIFLSVDDFNPEDVFGDGPVIETAEDTVVNGYPARRLTGYIGAVGGNTPQRYEGVVIPHNGSYYTIFVYELKYDDVQPIERQMGNVPPEALAVLEHVLATFTLF